MSAISRWAERHLDVTGESGEEIIALCPFHGDTHPSFYLNKHSGLWLCHACGVSGNRNQLSQRLLGVEFGEQTTVNDLLASIDRLTEAEHRRPPVPESILGNYEFPTTYWREHRGFGPEVIERFQLGFDPMREHATIPVRDHTGELLGIIRRVLREGGGPKYLHPKGLPTSELLFGSWLPLPKRVFLTEGPLDAISLWDVGLPALAQFGSHLKAAQAELLHRLGVHSVCVWPDNDQAGIEGLKKTRDVLTGIRMEVVIPREEFKDANSVPPPLRTEMAMHRVDWMTLVL